jgi:hypothetical protein
MKTVACTLAVLFACCALRAQQPTDDAVVTKQCSAIRELVYSAWNAQFEPIRSDELRSSNGYQTAGTWQFTTTRFSTTVPWHGANISYIEHYEESTDSIHTDQWQYIAEYSHVPDVLEAERLYQQLNNQISGCPYPLNDTTDLAFIELPPDRLPAERPSSLEIASLYELPMADSSDARQPAAITLMVGMEKRAKDYRVSLIVENRTIDNRTRNVGKLN